MSDLGAFARTTTAGHGREMEALPIVLIADRASAAEEAIALAGRRVARWLRWHEVGGALPSQLCRAPLMIEATGVSDDLLQSVLPAVEAHAKQQGIPVIASLSTAQIDLVVGGLPGPDTQFLCEPSLADRVAALSVLGGASPATLDDAARDTERTRFRRLNEELARISEVLTRLTREEETRAATEQRVADQRTPFDDTGASDQPAVTAADIRRALRSRRMRDQFFQHGLFEDPAWDMLLDLFAAELEHAQVSVSSLCIAAAVAPTTALRWIAKLSDHDLLVRRPDPTDRRRAFIGLSEMGLQGMQAYCRAVQRAGLAIA